MSELLGTGNGHSPSLNGAPPLSPAARPAGRHARPTPSAGTALLLPLHALAARAPVGGADHWQAAVAGCDEAALLLGVDGRVVALSHRAAELLGRSAAGCLGQVLPALVQSVDFSADPGPDPDIERALPPLRALSQRVLARGLVRWRCDDGSLCTADVVSLPLDAGGSLSFLHAV